MIDFPRYSALSFDCYGTLIDWESGLAAILQPWAARSGISVSREGLLAAFGEAEARAEADHPSRLYPDILRRVLRSLAARFEVPEDHAAEDELAHSVGDWAPFPDTVEALRSLKKHYKLAILSNVDRASFARSNARLGVDFDLVITAQDVGTYKPSLQNFRALVYSLADLGIPKDRLLHVAQSLYHDHVPAKRLDLMTVWIDRRHHQPGSGATLSPAIPVAPDAQFLSLAAFAASVESAFRNRE